MRNFKKNVSTTTIIAVNTRENVFIMLEQIRNEYTSLAEGSGWLDHDVLRGITTPPNAFGNGRAIYITFSFLNLSTFEKMKGHVIAFKLRAVYLIQYRIVMG